MEVKGRMMVVYICTSSGFGFLQLFSPLSAPLFRFDILYQSFNRIFDFFDESSECNSEYSFTLPSATLP